MKDVLYLALRYLRFHRGKTAVLVASISLILFLPAALQVSVQQGAEALTRRADSTPLLLGARGSAVDLTLAALYFRPPTLEPLEFHELARLEDEGLATAIPLHLRFQVREHRIVGTTPDYLEMRGLTLAEGRRFALLGECVLGAEAARSLGAAPGDHVLSSPAGAFDVAGSFPLLMQVVGVLEASGTPDDEAVLVDVKTSWVIAGLAHGHDDVTAPGNEAGVLAREADNVVANKSVLSYSEITPENQDSFHFHGDPEGFPVDALVVVPYDLKSSILLRGRYDDPASPVQLVIPRAVVDELVETMFSVRDVVFVLSLGLGLATIATAILVFALSIRLRHREIETMRKIGTNQRRIRWILATEILLVALSSLAIAVGATTVVSCYGPALIQHFTG